MRGGKNAPKMLCSFEKFLPSSSTFFNKHAHFFRKAAEPLTQPLAALLSISPSFLPGLSEHEAESGHVVHATPGAVILAS